MFWKFVVGAIVLPLGLGLEIAAATVKNEVHTPLSFQTQTEQNLVEPILSNQETQTGELYSNNYYHKPKKRHSYKRSYRKPRSRKVYYRNCNYRPRKVVRHRKVYRHGNHYPYYQNVNYRRHYYHH